MVIFVKTLAFTTLRRNNLMRTSDYVKHESITSHGANNPYNLKTRKIKSCVILLAITFLRCSLNQYKYKAKMFALTLGYIVDRR